jgi:RNA polymerase sigma factor (sigma-70 family)
MAFFHPFTNVFLPRRFLAMTCSPLPYHRSREILTPFFLPQNARGERTVGGDTITGKEKEGTMHKRALTSKTGEQQTVAGELQQLRERLLTDRDGFLLATRARLTHLAQVRGIAPENIDDVVQETLLEAWTHLDRLYAPEGFASWIDEICRNVCRRAARRQAVDLHRSVPLFEPPFPLSQEPQAPRKAAIDLSSNLEALDALDPLEALSRQDLVFLLDQALGFLAPEARRTVEMCYLLEFPRAEVAAHLGISNSTLETRLHRTRRQLRQILSGPLRREAEEFGLALDTAIAEGWQETRLWCPLCARHRLQGCFMHVEDEVEGPNLHLRCPDCSQRYAQDTVHSMGLISLTGLHAFRPAWKRTMQGLTDFVLQALTQDQNPCLFCGKPALVVQVRGGETETSSDPYPFWIYLRCIHCGRDMDARGNIPSVDQLVYWSHPLTRQFLLNHPRSSSAPGRKIEVDGQPALSFQITDRESANHITILAHPQTLRVLTCF